LSYQKPPSNPPIQTYTKPQEARLETHLNDISSTVTALLPFLNTLTATDGKSLLGVTYEISTSLSKAIDAQNQTQKPLNKADERITHLAKHVAFLEQNIEGVKQERTNHKEQGDKEARRLDEHVKLTEKRFEDVKGMLEKIVDVLEGRVSDPG
jgi:chromosome segregation ATPase